MFSMFKKYVCLTAVLCLVAIFPIYISGQALTSDQLLDKIDTFRIPHDEFMIRTRITTYSQDVEKETALFDAYISGPEKSLVIQKEGKNRRMKILYREEKLWVSLPGSRRPLRITPIQRLMGQASNGDIARIGWKADYTAEKAGEETLNGKACVKLSLKARKKSATYAAITLWVSRTDFRPVKGDFFLASGKLIKKISYDLYDLYEGNPFLKKMTITNEIRKSEKTVFTYEEVRPETVPAKYYNKNYLIHVRGM